MNKVIIAAALLAVSSVAMAQQALDFKTEPNVTANNPQTRTSEGGSSYIAEIPQPATPQVSQVIAPAPVVVAAAPTPVADIPPAPVVAAAPVAPAPVVAPRKADRN
jgi:hypothetical protein